MKKDAYYFPHDSNAKDDPKCTQLIDELGLEGYGIYWVLIETLRDQMDYRYPMKLIPSLARKYNTTAKKIQVVVKSYDLFGVDEDSFFFSDTLNQRMLKVNERRAALSEAGKRGNEKRWKEAIALPSPGDYAPIAVKESKSNKTKEEESKEKEILLFPVETLITKTSDDLMFEKFNQWLSVNAPTVLKMKEQITLPQLIKIKEGFRADLIYQKLEAMHNKKTLCKDYTSAYLTLLNWCKNESTKTETNESEQKTDYRILEKLKRNNGQNTTSGD